MWPHLRNNNVNVDNLEEFPSSISSPSAIDTQPAAWQLRFANFCELLVVVTLISTIVVWYLPSSSAVISHCHRFISQTSTVVQLLNDYLRQRRPSAFDFIVAWYLPQSSAVTSHHHRSISTVFAVYPRSVLGWYRSIYVAAPSRDQPADTFQSTLWCHLPNVASSSSCGRRQRRPIADHHHRRCHGHRRPAKQTTCLGVFLKARRLGRHTSTVAPSARMTAPLSSVTPSSSWTPPASSSTHLSVHW